MMFAFTALARCTRLLTIVSYVQNEVVETISLQHMLGLPVSVNNLGTMLVFSPTSTEDGVRIIFADDGTHRLTPIVDILPNTRGSALSMDFRTSDRHGFATSINAADDVTNTWVMRMALFVWSMNPQVNLVTHDPNDFMLDVFRGLTLNSQAQFPALAGALSRSFGFFRRQHPNPPNFVDQVPGVRIRVPGIGLTDYQPYTGRLLRTPMVNWFRDQTLTARYGLQDLSPAMPTLRDGVGTFNGAPVNIDPISEDERIAASALLMLCGGSGSDFSFRRRQTTCDSAEGRAQTALQQSSISSFRVQGQLRSFISLGSRALTVVGEASTVLLPVFIILDFIEGQWVAAAWTIGAAAAGVAAEILTTLAIGAAEVAGPVGLFVGALVGLLFSIIPGLVQKKNYPKTNNVTQIIQYAFFGDAEHTGNELCNEKLVKNGQTPNCTAAYSSGTLAVIPPDKSSSICY